MKKKKRYTSQKNDLGKVALAGVPVNNSFG